VERLKFAEALPDEATVRVVEARLRDDRAVEAVGRWPVRVVRKYPASENVSGGG